jgi:hypothetical protein
MLLIQLLQTLAYTLCCERWQQGKEDACLGLYWHMRGSHSDCRLQAQTLGLA